MQFTYEMPSRLISGRNCVREKAGEMKSFGKKAIIVTGRHSAKENGALEDLLFALKKNEQDYVIYDQAIPNPTIACAREGAKLAREEKVDFVIAIGGGSPMDTGKAIALMAKMELEDAELFSCSYDEGALPIVCIPTTAGTGSEVTRVSVLIYSEKETKCSIGGRAMFPKLSYLDGKYMEKLSREVTLNTAIDAMSHAIEGMLSLAASPMSDRLGEESLCLLSSYLPKIDQLEKNPEILSPEDRDQLLYAAMLAGMVIANTGTNVVHAMGYGLTCFQGTDHGRANGLLMAAYLKKMAEELPDRVSYILQCMGYQSLDEMKESWAALLGERESLTEKELEKYTDIVIHTKAGSLAKCKKRVSAEEVKEIYRTSIRMTE